MHLRLLILLVIIARPPAIAHAQSPHYQVTDLGSLGGPYAYPASINAVGEICGDSENARGELRAFKTPPRVGFDRPIVAANELPLSSAIREWITGNEFALASTHARGMNERGDVVGWIVLRTRSGGTWHQAITWWNVGGVPTPELMHITPRTIGPYKSFYGISEVGDRVGVAVTFGEGCRSGCNVPVQVARDGTVRYPAGATGDGHAAAIDPTGELVVGSFAPAWGTPKQAQVWVEGERNVLRNAVADGARIDSVNSYWFAVGTSGDKRPFFTGSDAYATLLTLPSGYLSGSANALNGSNQIIGSVSTRSDGLASVPMYWHMGWTSESVRMDETRVTAGFLPQNLFAINRWGDMVGWASNGTTQRAVKLTPRPMFLSTASTNVGSWADVEVRVTSARPNEDVVLYTTTSTPAASDDPYHWGIAHYMTRSSTRVGTVRADASGRATLRFAIPVWNGRVWVQALQRGHSSLLLRYEVTPSFVPLPLPLPFSGVTLTPGA